jgi:type I restriction enzyme S subunit
MATFRELSAEPAAWLLDGAALVSERLDASYYAPRFLRDVEALDQLPMGVKSLRSISSKLNCGATPKFVQYGSTGLPLIRTSNVRPDLYDEADTLRVPGMVLDRTSNVAILPGDVLYTMSGTIGFSAVYPAHGELASCSNTIARARLSTQSDADPYYVALFLNSRLGMSQSLRLVSGGVLAHVMPNSVKTLRVALPEPGVQRAIGNRVRKAERLREMADAAARSFRDWLDRASCRTALPPDDAPFLKHSPDDTCPDTTWVTGFDAADRIDPWPHHVAPRRIIHHLRSKASARQFRDVFQIVAGDRQRRGANEPGSDHHISVLDVDSSGHIDWAAAAVNRYDGTGVEIRAGDILFSCLNPKEARIGYIPISFKGTAVASPEFSVLRLRSDIEQVPYLMAAVLRSPWVRVQTTFLTRSSSLSRRRLDEGDLAGVVIPWHEEGIAELNERMETAADSKHEAVDLVRRAKADVETLIAGTLDVPSLLAEGEEIDRWLRKHPSPNAQRRAT